MDELKPIIRSLAISSAGGLTLQQLERDFKCLEGYSIPYQRLGFKSLASLLQTLTDVVRLKGTDQQSTIHPITTDKNEHILAMVEKSKKSKKKPTFVRDPLPQRPKSSSRSSSSSKPTFVHESVPQRPKSSSSKPCNEIQKYTTRHNEKYSASYGHSSRCNGAVPTAASSSSLPLPGNYKPDYHFEQFLQWLYDMLKDNENSNGQSADDRKRTTAAAKDNQSAKQRPPSAQFSGQGNNSGGWNNNSAGWNNNYGGWSNNSARGNNNPRGRNNNSAGWNNNYGGWNNNSARCNTNPGGWNNNSAGWNYNYGGWSNNSARGNNNPGGWYNNPGGWNNNPGGWNNNSAGWNNNSAGCNYNTGAGNTNNYANHGHNYWNGNYPINSNYGNNGYDRAGAPGYQNQYGGYAMNYATNYGYNSSNGVNGQNCYTMGNWWNSYGQYLPYYYSSMYQNTTRFG
ncbi:putative uncharacterized protein DDB_G0286901 [Anopheles stephensi]|uniref:putative uncharacterized protein DDB_G0286901 n=1 Tax=Anopheles stephensi TaxID=30069 RepID=UPI001658A298|nr:putative uncharacterized protein DDB_G0286901 [Anopheles stephensi]